MNDLQKETVESGGLLPVRGRRENTKYTGILCFGGFRG
jgi:hypothetical protein